MAYTRLTRFALWALTVIVVTGAAVRLTGSGLGCEDWPTCSEDRFIADLEYHALVEFVNRLFTGVVAIAVIAAVLGSVRRRPRRSDLTVLSLGLVAGVLAQVGLGALLVLSELDPRFTMGHFLLSMVLLQNAAVLDARARAGAGLEEAAPRSDDASRPGSLDQPMRWAVLAVGAVLLVSGTLVTGAGPHAGDSRAERLPLLVREVARIHSIIALILLGMVVWTWWRLRTAGSVDHTLMGRAERSADRARMGRVAVLLAVQGAVGYTQYFAGVPALLVGIHVALASVTWIEIVKAAHAPGARAAAEAERPEPVGGAAMAGARP